MYRIPKFHTLLRTALCAVALSAARGVNAEEAHNVAFAKGSKYARPFNPLVTNPGGQYLLGPTGIFAYGPYGAKAHGKPDRNWFVVISITPKSPAEGHVFPDDVITGANGAAFPEGVDARIPLGRAIIDSEAADGTLTLSINHRGKDMQVPLQLTPIGAHSPTWPFACARTDTMVTDACRFLQEEQLPNGYIPADEGKIGTSSGGLLFLGSGQPEYLENARRAAYWFADLVTDLEAKGETLGWGPWAGGYGGILLAEYYQMTGDKGILPGLEILARQVARGQLPSGGWGHNFFNGYSAGYGEVNNCGITSYMALVLARECGVPVDEKALEKARRYFGAFAPTVASQYGDHDLVIEGYNAWNGKVGSHAVLHRIEGKEAYSRAYALKAARSVNMIERGHAGHFANDLWTPVAASFAPAGEYRRAMDQLDWYYALCRGPRGGFYCQPGNHGGEPTTVGENMTTGTTCLSLIVPRRHLRILGAPKSVFVVDLPGELAAACDLHQSHQWDACIAAVDRYLENEQDPEKVRLANELRDKARYVKAGVTGTLDDIEAMLTVKNPNLNLRHYEIKHMLRPLKGLLGAGDPRLKAIEERLPYEEKAVGKTVYMKGREYYEACEALKYLRMELWWVYGQYARNHSRFMVVVPRDDWSVIYEPPTPSASGTTAGQEGKGEAEAEGDEKALPRYAALEAGATPPTGWQKPDFDDAAWADRVPGGKKGQYVTGMVRIPFDLKTTRLSELRLAISGRGKFVTGTRVFLNGELVLKCNGDLNGKPELLRSTVELLKEGRNLLAIEFPHTRSVPAVALEAKLLGGSGDFAWTPVPGRDKEILTLTSQRLMPKDYYVAAGDTRGVKEIMAVLHQVPSFMPELYNAMERFKTVVPAEQRPSYIGELLDSHAWGGRMVGLMLVGLGVNEPVKGRMSNEEFAEAKETFLKLRAKYAPFKARVEALLTDPHPLVQTIAARAIAGYSDLDKRTVSTLITLLEDTEENHWWVRESAYKALSAMSLDPETTRTYMLIALRDPSGSVRRHPQGQTFKLRNAEEREKIMRAFQDAMVDQIFDSPLQMWTGGAPKTVAENLKGLGKDAIRPYLPRFFTALNDPTGNRLVGASNLIAWFGEEVIDKVEGLTKDENKTIRVNAINILTQMGTEESLPPEVRGRIVTCLEAAKKDLEESVSRAAEQGLKKIAAAVKKEKE